MKNVKRIANEIIAALSPIDLEEWNKKLTTYMQGQWDSSWQGNEAEALIQHLYDGAIKEWETLSNDDKEQLKKYIREKF